LRVKSKAGIMPIFHGTKPALFDFLSNKFLPLDVILLHQAKLISQGN